MQIVLIDNKPVNIVTLISLIEKAKFIISNDTGPAHLFALKQKRFGLFGSHTTPEKVSIKNSNLKIIKVDNLQKLKSEDVLSETIKYLN